MTACPGDSARTILRNTKGRPAPVRAGRASFTRPEPVAMKKLVNRPSDVVQEMLEGIARQSPHVAILGDEHVLVRQPLPGAQRRRRPLGGGSGRPRTAAMSAKGC